MSSGQSFYHYGTPPPRPARVTTSRKELTDIAIAFTVLTFDLLILLSGDTFLGGGIVSGHLSPLTPLGLGVAASATLTGFVAHEIAHKIEAQRRGFWAEFRMWPMGLLYSVFSAVLGVIMAAPGATVVGGMSELDASSWGRTSLAGPATNFVFGVVFFAGSIAAFDLGSWVFPILLLLAFFNAWFGTFNLLPVWLLDGRKVLRWSTPIWVTAFLGTGALAVLTGLGLFYFGTPLPPV
jgi:Zn-dependent protease